MKNKCYLLINVLLGILTLNLSEARVMNPGAGKTIGSPSWSVTIPVVNKLILVERQNEAVDHEYNKTVKSRGKISENQSPLPQDRGFIPKQGNTQSGNEGAIFDRWGNMKK